MAPARGLIVHPQLAVRSDFTIGQSTLSLTRTVKVPNPEGGKPKSANELSRLATLAGLEAVAVTDDMTVTGLIGATQALKGVKVIGACRVRWSDDPTWRKPKGDKRARPPADRYLTVYVRSEAGLRMLYRVVSLGNDADHFYNKARVSWTELLDALATVTGADVAVATSDADGLATDPLFHNRVVDLNATLGSEHVYLTLTALSGVLWDTLNARTLRVGAATGNRFLTTRPAFYAPGGADVADVMRACAGNTPLSSVFAPRPAHRDAALGGVAPFMAAVRDSAGRLVAMRGFGPEAPRAFAAGVRATRELVDSVSYGWAKGAVSLPRMAEDEFAALKEMVMAGWRSRFGRSTFGHQPGGNELQAAYLPRLKFELETLKRLDFSGYFLLVADVVRHAKGQGILVGPGRGSVGGSLVAYLMGITDCDPLRFGLLFERFINPDRLDLPDADLDFMAGRRHEVVSYLIGKYGSARVAGVTNFGTLQSASALGQVAKAHGLDPLESSCTKLVPKHAGVPLDLETAAGEVGEIDKFRKRHGKVWNDAVALQGTMRSLGQHAAGIIVAGRDIVELAAIERRKAAKADADGEGAVAVETVVGWDKRAIEDQGLVKMDILGLSTLDIIALALAYVRERAGDAPDLMDLDLEDPRVLDTFAKGETTGVFQFESGGMKRLLRNLGASGAVTFEDITACTALYRPGPMESGMMDSYWRRKQGLESIEYLHPKAREATADTYGVMVYQEQVMRVSRDVAGYTAGGADKLRKIMGKKLPAEMEKERPNFVAGCKNTVGMSEEDAGELFDKIATFAGYGFNRSHSVEYSLISFQSAYLKTYHTVEFVAAALSIMKPEKVPLLLAEAKRLGISVRYPDINLSTDRFEILSDTELIIPFNRVKGLSPNTARAIVAARAAGPFASRDDVLKRVNRRTCNVAKIDALERIGALADIMPGTLAARHEDRIRDQAELIPGLVTDVIPIHRKMNLCGRTRERIAEVVNRYQRDHADDGMPVRPLAGRRAGFVAIFDAPSSGRDSDETHGQMAQGRQFTAVSEALREAGLERGQGYWTAVLKRPREGKSVTPGEVNTYAPYLEEELAILRPAVVVTLGGTALRRFFPEWKGRASESAGKILYHKGLDCNVVVGFSPGEIFFDPDKQGALNEVFATLANMVD